MGKSGSGEMQKTQTILESTLESVDAAEIAAIEAAREMGFDEDEQLNIGMAVRECAVNAVVHGNGYSKKKNVHLSIERSEDDLVVLIGDEGAGFDLSSLPDPLAEENILRQSGRGLLLIRTFMDEVDLHPRAGGGTEVRLVKHLSKN